MPAPLQEVRNVLHLLEGHLAVVDAPDRARLYLVHRLAEQHSVLESLHKVAPEALACETLNKALSFCLQRGVVLQLRLRGELGVQAVHAILVGGADGLFDARGH